MSFIIFHKFNSFNQVNELNHTKLYCLPRSLHATQQADIITVAGDITKDGELVCHQKMAAYFNKLKLSGAEVVVVPGKHDLNNPNAVKFDGD